MWAYNSKTNIYFKSSIEHTFGDSLSYSLKLEKLCKHLFVYTIWNKFVLSYINDFSLKIIFNIQFNHTRRLNNYHKLLKKYKFEIETD